MKNIAAISLLLLAIVSSVMLISCKPTVGSTNSNLAFLYKKEKGFLHPEYQPIHISDEITEVHFKFRSSELLYTKSPANESFLAKYTLAWMLLDEYGSVQIHDSGSVTFEDQFNKDPDKMILGSVKIKAPSGKKYLLAIELADLHRSQKHTQYIYIEKTNTQEHQNYSLCSGASPARLLFRSTVSLNEPVRFAHRNKEQSLFVRYYNREFPLPPPPFSYFTPKGFDFKADSFYKLNAANDTFNFSALQPGIYHFQTDTSKVSGFTIFCYAENYPKMKTYEGMIAPIRYLTTKNEYEKMLRYPNSKAAVDSFWLSCAGSVDRGKDLIRKYYSRIHEANSLFSSYLEGWKSDRGIVFVIYGPPNAVYRNEKGENWVYGEENNLNSLTFSFTRFDNPFTTNDYRLERSSTYQDGWYKAANAWREGRVFIDN